MNSMYILTAMFISLVVHEGCHALALRIIGAPIELFQIGTPIIYRRGILSLGLIPLFGGVQADFTGVSLAKQAYFYTAGPVGSLLLGIGSMQCGIWLNVYSMKLLGMASFAFGFFNLIPVLPMDGFKLVTLGRQVPYPLQILWAVAGWTLIAAITLWRKA